MKVYRCERCEGCGYVVGGFRWETPWVRAMPGDQEADGILEPHACPDCGGTGALIDMGAPAPEPALPSRYGVPVRHDYARHVARVRHAQGGH